MKKRGFLLAACTVGVMLSGCGSRETAFSPSESCVYVAKDGALSSALVEQTGGISVDENELKQYLETAVIHFNEEKGAGALAQNQKNAERLPAALKSVKAGKDTVTAIMPRCIPDRRYQIPDPGIIFRLILNGQTGTAARYRRILAPKYGALRLPCTLFPSFQAFPKRQHGGILLCPYFWNLAASFIFDINFFSSCSIQFKYLR